MKPDALSPAEQAFRALLANPVAYSAWAEQTRQEWAARQPPPPSSRPAPSPEPDDG
jgi:hypothetical protein